MPLCLLSAAHPVRANRPRRLCSEIRGSRVLGFKYLALEDFRVLGAEYRTSRV